jgi:hypothetical protein
MDSSNWSRSEPSLKELCKEVGGDIFGFRVLGCSADSGWRVLLETTCKALGVDSEDTSDTPNWLPTTSAPIVVASGEGKTSIGFGASTLGEAVAE